MNQIALDPQPSRPSYRPVYLTDRSNRHSKRTHGLSDHPLYQIWNGIRGRCYNKRVIAYTYYGGRGIGMCEEWLNSPQAFFDYVGERPSKLHGIDRWPNNNGNYEPGNVRWALMKDQNSNRRSNLLVTYKNRTQTVTQWAIELGLHAPLINLRLKRYDMPVALALYTGRINGTTRVRIESSLRIADPQAFDERLNFWKRAEVHSAAGGDVRSRPRGPQLVDRTPQIEGKH